MKFISRVEQANLTRSLCSLMRYPGQYSYFSPHIHVLLSISIYSHIHVVFMSLMEIILLIFTVFGDNENQKQRSTMWGQ